MFGGLLTLVVVLLVGALYLLPGLIAIHRGHPDKGLILVLNLIFGWSVVGWFVLLVLAQTQRSLRAR